MVVGYLFAVGTNRNVSAARDIDRYGLSAYILIAICEFHLQTEPIVDNEMPSRYRSPATPDLKECGVTFFTSARAACSFAGSARSNTLRSHAWRSSLEQDCPTTGRNTCLSLLARNESKCQRMSVAADNTVKRTPCSSET